jgi:MerR family transcriptional regulator/heat shock protein HspR
VRREVCGVFDRQTVDGKRCRKPPVVEALLLCGTLFAINVDSGIGICYLADADMLNGAGARMRGEGGFAMVRADDVEVRAVEAGIEPAGGAKRAAGRGRAHRGRGAGRETRLSQITADRPIFTLSVAADLLGLHPRTLRIYEEKRLVLPARTEGNRRRYSQNDIQRFQFIRRLTGGGVNLEGVRVILDMADEVARLGGDPNEIIERNLHDLDTDGEEE